jgi:ectoine hydroxylase-related dioxygenase (phytanoyl-CoA dioxygenase family)
MSEKDLEQMHLSQALQEFGVNDDTLTQDEKNQLDENGFVLLRNILSPEQVESFNARLDELLSEEGEQAGIEMHQEAGTERLARLVDKDSLFDICFTHPRVLAAAAHVLGEIRLGDVVSRFAMPGQGAQGLHADAAMPETPGAYTVCNTFWLLDDFTANNGSTRVVPGTHKRTPLSAEDDNLTTGDDGLLHHPDEIKVLAPAGTVVIFNSHLLHGGTLNTTSERRRAISSFFVRPDYTGFSSPNDFSPRTRERLGEAARTILGL